MEECRKELQEKQEEVDLKTEQEVEWLKSEIQSVREERSKLRSVTSSSASVTIYPPSTPSSEGVQSNENSLAGSPDATHRKEEVISSKDDDESTGVTRSPGESVVQEENQSEPETTNIE